MNRIVFGENLLKALDEISVSQNTKLDKSCKFRIVPIQEEKTYNTKDEVMKRWIISEKNLKDKYLSFDSVVKLFSGLEPLYPLWINVIYKGMSEGLNIIELETSLRFRKPSQLQNKETGHAPFKVIYTEQRDLY